MEDLFRFLLKNFRKYLRIDVHGLQYIPKRGRALVAPNHSGCAGLDAVMLTYLLNEDTPRIPRILAVWNRILRFPILSTTVQKLGMKPASTESGIRLLRKNNLVICFPEGEAGSFKPTSERYQLQPFHTGFVRMALMTGAPIIPCVVIGAEESNICLGTLTFKGRKKSTLVPVPFNLLPLPAKWDIHFFPPMDLSGYRQYADDKEKLQALADLVRATMQRAIEAELSERKFVYVNGS